MEFLRRLKTRGAFSKPLRVGTASKLLTDKDATEEEWNTSKPTSQPVESGSSTRSLAIFPPLPHELIVLILRFALAGEAGDYLIYLGDGEPERSPLTSKREQLKRLRLEGRAFCDAVTPAIFATIHIHANDLSFDRAFNIGYSRFAGLVKEIVAHGGSFADNSHAELFFLFTLQSHRRRQDYPREEIDGMVGDTSAMYSNYVEEVKAAQFVPFQRRGKYEFHEMFAQFPNLLTIVCPRFYDDWNDPEQSAYAMRRTGLSYLPTPVEVEAVGPPVSTGQAPYTWLAHALSALQPKVLNLTFCPRQAIEQGFFGDADDSNDNLKQRCARLKHLIIGSKFSSGISTSTDGKLWGPEWSGRMYSLLTASSSTLTHLELTSGFPVAHRFLTVPKGSLPCLKHLTFSGEDPYRKWPVEGVIKWIEAVSDSLENLDIWNIELLHCQEDTHGGYDLNVDVADYDQDLRHSLITLCCRITMFTKLKRMKGLETVEDNKGPATGSAWKRKRMLCRKVEEAVCHHREWPLDLLQYAELNSWNTLPGSSELDRRRTSFLLKPWELTADEFENQGQIYQDPAH